MPRNPWHGPTLGKVQPKFWGPAPGTNLPSMGQKKEYNLVASEIAKHYALTSRTVRAKLNDGVLQGVRVNGVWRCSWQDVWDAEKGPEPRGSRAELYKAPLLTKKSLASKWSVSERTIERWIQLGLPTRNVFGSVRIAPIDVDEWTARTFGIAGNAA